ncbi:ExbD/TolR family protein [Blastomonas aquatica]|uniref:Biopolymer transporter ExbD n=1 Tax=Blastomonas aquatica TaxID=1510276 RepID=A0ABQ1JFH8_9SPHN|nr:biopolymer transporter ExbD [Blastomonas aquatica]GGB67067.1 biopolymer transporter ExbD [Blastomonas aquatica]
MAMSGGSDDGEPMMEMNTTPLIDVMLVLLIMFIITIPVQTHAVKIDLPVDSPTPPEVVIEPVKNKLTVDVNDTLAWNGTPVSQSQLAGILAQTRNMEPEPELQFQPDARARYQIVDEVLVVIKRSGVTKLGFVGNEQYGTFQKAAAN